MRIIRADSSHLSELTDLFHDYRLFYHLDSCLEDCRAFLQQRLEHGDALLLLAADEEQPVGFLQMYPLFSEVTLAPLWLVNDLFVVPGSRRKGVASSLLERARTEAAARGARGLTLSTAHDNTSAQALYRRHGYVRDDQFQHYTLSWANPDTKIEPFDEARHSVDSLTALLHRAYARLLALGLHFWATTQPPEVTLKRLTSGQGWVARQGERLVGTITYYDDCPDNDCAWYQRPEVSRFGQFAVDPDLQSAGIGARLLATAEAWARSRGKTELALDTSEKAEHLIEYYGKKGFRFVQTMQWHGVNYRSVVMSKELQ